MYGVLDTDRSVNLMTAGGVEEARRLRTSFSHLVTVFRRRLWLPTALFAGFNVLCVIVYRRLEGLRWPDAFFWITHPHSMELAADPSRTKVLRVLRLPVRVCLSNVDCRTSPGNDLPPPGDGGLEINDQ